MLNVRMFVHTQMKAIRADNRSCILNMILILIQEAVRKSHICDYNKSRALYSYSDRNLCAKLLEKRTLKMRSRKLHTAQICAKYVSTPEHK